MNLCVQRRRGISSPGFFRSSMEFSTAATIITITTKVIV
jgi:hypothetical protein